MATHKPSRQTKDQLCPFHTFNSLVSPSSCNDSIITVEDNKEITLKPKYKRSRSWWENVEEYNELCPLYKGVQKPKDNSNVVSRFDSCFSSTNKPLSSLSSTIEIINIEDDDEEETLESKKKKPRLGSLYDDSSAVKGSLKAKDKDATSSRVDSCFSSTDPHEKKKKKDERSVSSHKDIIELCADETTSTSFNKGYRHVTLEDLGVSVEDLKSIPWEGFDPTWEIRSVAMDPWLGGYVQDMFSSC